MQKFMMSSHYRHQTCKVSSSDSLINKTTTKKIHVSDSCYIAKQFHNLHTYILYLDGMFGGIFCLRLTVWGSNTILITGILEHCVGPSDPT